VSWCEAPVITTLTYTVDTAVSVTDSVHATHTTLRGIGVAGNEQLLVGTGLDQVPAHVVHVAESRVQLDQHTTITY